MDSSKEQFKTGIDKAFSSIELNPSTMGDANKLKTSFMKN